MVERAVDVPEAEEFHSYQRRRVLTVYRELRVQRAYYLPVAGASKASLLTITCRRRGLTLPEKSERGGLGDCEVA